MNTKQLELEELYKTANSRCTLIVEFFQGEKEKISFKLIERTSDNKSCGMLVFYIDIATAKVLFNDAFNRQLEEKFDMVKKKGQLKSLTISPPKNNKDVYHVRIQENGKSLFINISEWTLRELSITVLDHINHKEAAYHQYAVVQNKPKQQNQTNPNKPNQQLQNQPKEPKEQAPTLPDVRWSDWEHTKANLKYSGDLTWLQMAQGNALPSGGKSGRDYLQYLATNLTNDPELMYVAKAALKLTEQYTQDSFFSDQPEPDKHRDPTH